MSDRFRLPEMILWPWTPTSEEARYVARMQTGQGRVEIVAILRAWTSESPRRGLGDAECLGLFTLWDRLRGGR